MTTPDDAQHRVNEIVHQARRCWSLRADALGLRGKSRDRACLEWLAGMRIGLLFSDGKLEDPDARTPLDGIMQMVAATGSRGFEYGSYSNYLKITGAITSETV